MLTVSRPVANQEVSNVKKGIQFLSPKHITNPSGHVAKISKMTTDTPDTFGNPYTLYVSFGGVKYSKGLKPTSDHLADLVSFLGADEKKWANQEILIGKKTDEEGAERLTFGPKPKK